MNHSHANSPCCHAPVRRYGARRRECSHCHRTWRIRQKRRGRKRHRGGERLVVSVLEGRTTIAAAARRRGVSAAMLEKRFQRSLERLLTHHATAALPRGTLILIVDGLWTFFSGYGRFTLYLMAVRATDETVAHFLDPVLLAGQESLAGWQQAIASLPDSILRRIGAVVSDGLRGMRGIAETRGWLFQRCHFHLLAWLQRKRGQRLRRGESRWIRDAVLAYVQVMLSTSEARKLREFQRELTVLSRDPDCPRYLTGRIAEFLRTLPDYRTYLAHPALHLPATTNTVETMIRLLRRLLGQIHGTRTPEAFLRWTTAYVRLKRTIACNGKLSTKFIP